MQEVKISVHKHIEIKADTDFSTYFVLEYFAHQKE